MKEGYASSQCFLFFLSLSNHYILTTVHSNIIPQVRFLNHEFYTVEAVGSPPLPVTSQSHLTYLFFYSLCILWFSHIHASRPYRTLILVILSLIHFLLICLVSWRNLVALSHSANQPPSLLLPILFKWTKSRLNMVPFNSLSRSRKLTPISFALIRSIFILASSSCTFLFASFHILSCPIDSLGLLKISITITLIYLLPSFISFTP